MQTFAKELVGLQPDLILASTTPVVAAVAQETDTIPIVFVVVSDPIGSRFVESLPRPGRNITGFINIKSSLGGKWLELLKEIAPRISRVSVMFNPDTAPHADITYAHSKSLPHRSRFSRLAWRCAVSSRSSAPFRASGAPLSAV